jgi:uncharacterized membrane protein
MSQNRKYQVQRRNVQQDNPSGNTNAQEITATLNESAFPPAEELEKYGRIDTGLINRIFSMAESEQQNRFLIQKEELKQRQATIELSKDEGCRAEFSLKIESRNSILGLIFALIVFLSTLAATIYFVTLGNNIAGSLFGAGGLIMIIGPFIYGTKFNNKSK